MICFSKKSSKVNPDQVKVILDGEQLKLEDDTQFLGLTIDCFLNWEKQCINVANKISQSNSVLNRVKKLLPPCSLKCLYDSFIQSHLQYALPVWGGCSNPCKKRIVSIQKRAIRTITKSQFTAHTEPRMKISKILHFDDLWKHQSLMLIHDCVNNTAPKEICNLINHEPQRSGPTLRSQNSKSQNLVVARSNSKSESQSFSINGPSLWNDLPYELKIIKKRHIFKESLKKFYLSKYHVKTECNNPRCKDKRYHTPV